MTIDYFYQSNLLASGDIETHTFMKLFPLNIYLQEAGYPTNCPIGYPGNNYPDMTALLNIAL